MKKKFFAVATFALAFAFAFSASAAYDLGSTTLKRGATGNAVMQLQEALATCNGFTGSKDGKFGPGTEAGVKAFQASKGLKADGLVGNATKAALNSCGSSTPSTPSSSAALCPNGMTLASNCTKSPSNSSSGMNLSGTAGDISSVTLLGSPSNIQVSEGETRQVAGFEVLAAPGSDLGVTSVRVDLENLSATGSLLLPRYINQLALFAGSTQVATVDASSVVRNGNNYSVTFNINPGAAVIPANQRAQMYIGVRANSTIDSGDIADGNATWTTTLRSIRFVDGSGAILTDSPDGIVRRFSFLKLSNNSSVKLRLSEDVNNPKDRTIVVSNTQITNNQELLRFSVRAEGSELRLRKITAQATSSTDVSSVAPLFKLQYNGNVIDSYTANTSSYATTEQIVFSQLNGGVGEIVIPAGTTANFSILADINSLNAYPAGSTLKVEIPSNFYTDNSKFTVEDLTGGSLSTNATNRPGSVTGYTVTLRTEGLTGTLNQRGASVNQFNNGKLVSSETVIRLNVAAEGNDFFIPRNATWVAGNGTTTPPTVAPTYTTGLSYAILNSSNQYVTAAGATGTLATGSVVSASVDLVSGGTLDNGVIKVSSGTSAVLELRVTLAELSGNEATAVGSYKVGVLSVNGANTSGATAFNSFATTPVQNFETSSTGAFTN